MNKIFIPTGYMGSGSSAITDILGSFEGFFAPNGSFEYVFLHCPNGLFDLEDKLLLNNNGLRSDEALRSFRDAMAELYNTPLWWPGNYRKHLSPRFMELTDLFIKSLIDIRSNNYWYYQEKRGVGAIPRLAINAALQATPLKYRPRQPLRYEKMTIALPTPEKFYTEATNYLDAIFKELAIEDSRLVLDQLILPFNAWRMEHYFHDNAECIIVSRDPRDVFLSNKYIWAPCGQEVPHPKDVVEFCMFYRRMRESERPFNNPHIHRIAFEDCVYRYEETVDKLGEIASLTHRPVLTGGTFDPEKSINNTQLFLLPQYAAEASIIEQELSEYLYDFPYQRPPSENRSF